MGFEIIKIVDMEKLTEKVAFEDSLTELRELSYTSIWGWNALFRRMNECSIPETKSFLVSVRNKKGIVW